MTIEKLKDNLVKATPADGKRLVNVDERTIAEGGVYAPSSEALAAWAEMDVSEAEIHAAAWAAADAQTLRMPRGEYEDGIVSSALPQEP